MKTMRIIVLLSLIFALGFYFLSPSKNDTTQSASISKTSFEEKAQPVVENKNSENQSQKNIAILKTASMTASEDSAEDKATALEAAPVDLVMRNEVEQNPHSPPLSLIRFATVLGKKLEKAEQSTEAAEDFMVELENCVLSHDREIAQIGRSLCLANAKRLAYHISSLTDRYQDLTHSADPELIRLAEMER